MLEIQSTIPKHFSNHEVLNTFCKQLAPSKGSSTPSDDEEGGAGGGWGAVLGGLPAEKFDCVCQSAQDVVTDASRSSSSHQLFQDFPRGCLLCNCKLICSNHLRLFGYIIRNDHNAFWSTEPWIFRSPECGSNSTRTASDRFSSLSLSLSDWKRSRETTSSGLSH